MKKTILGLSLVAILAGVGLAQVDSKTSSTVNNSTSVSKNGGNIDLQSGTQIAAQLQNSIDVQKAKVGDQVILKTTTAIKQNGKTVIDKGATLSGRVTEVQRKTKDNAGSKVGILFDKLQQGGNLTSELSAALALFFKVKIRPVKTVPFSIFAPSALISSAVVKEKSSPVFELATSITVSNCAKIRVPAFKTTFPWAKQSAANKTPTTIVKAIFLIIHLL